MNDKERLNVIDDQNHLLPQLSRRYDGSRVDSSAGGDLYFGVIAEDNIRMISCRLEYDPEDTVCAWSDVYWVDQEKLFISEIDCSIEHS